MNATVNILELKSIFINLKESDMFKDPASLRDEYKTYDVSFKHRSKEFVVRMVGYKDDEAAYRNLDKWVQLIRHRSENPK